MNIDCHGHFTTMPQAVVDWRTEQIAEFDRSGTHLSPDELQVSDDELRAAIENGQLPLLVERETDVSLFSPIAGRMAHHYGDERTSLEWSRIANDLIHRICTLFPDHFVGVCQLPQSPGASLAGSVKELQRCVEELGFVGCNLNPDPTDGYWTGPPITDRSFYPLYEKMVELGVPAMIHVSMSCNPAFHGTCAHYLNGDTSVFMQLCLSDLFRDFPDLRLIIPHGGGAVPYHWGRFRGVLQDMGRPPLEELILNNVFFDTCVYWQKGLELLIEAVPARNVLYASEMIGAVRGIDPRTGRRFDDTRFLLDSISSISESDRQLIYGDNALTVYPRLASVLEQRAMTRARNSP